MAKKSLEELREEMLAVARGQREAQPVSVMSHRGYQAQITYDAEDNLFIGHLTGIEGIVGFHGETTEEFVAAFHEAVDDYILVIEATRDSK